ncbi:MAG: hypothetical protein JWQ27_311 [Ferruginibacter sp.]|nr:hypothetical protein [Ferruginibacter sp.]
MNGKLVAFNSHSLAGKGKDTLTYRHPFTGALGISKQRKADIAWLYTDSTKHYAMASQQAIPATRDSIASFAPPAHFKKWKMRTAIGGGPVLLQNGDIKISNNEELKFNGKAINDKHPRTLIGYTADDHLIVMVVQGRFPGIAEGATITEEAELMKQLGCVEAINLDGGGSSCMLINGKPTITVSDKPGQRAVPAVFLIKARK